MRQTSQYIPIVWALALALGSGSAATLWWDSGSGEGGTPSPLAAPFLRWSDNFDDRTPGRPYDMRRVYTAYDDQDMSSATDYGDRVILSEVTFHSSPRSLRVRAVSTDTPGTNVPRALATSPYLRDWATEKGYWLNFTFRLDSTDNLRLVVMKTVDVYLVVAGTNSLLNDPGTRLWSFSQISGTAQVVTTSLSVDSWHTLEICVSCTGGSFAKVGNTYTLTLDGTSGSYTRFSTDAEPRSLAWGDLGNVDINTGATVANTRGAGFWDDVVLDYRPVVSNPEANAGPDQTAPEGQDVTFTGQGRGSVAPAHYTSNSGGFDYPISTGSSGTWVTRSTMGGNYVGLLAVSNGAGRAVFAPADGLSPRSTNRDAQYQMYINAVRWVTQDRSPSQTNVLLLWGYREIIAYHGGSVNQYRALLSEGYNVTLLRTLPTSLSPYHAVVMVSSGWGFGGQGQQAHPSNEGYCTSEGGNGDCPQGVDLTAAEGNLIAAFVAAGGGFVASAEENHGTHLNAAAGPLGVTFVATDVGAWTAPVVSGQENHLLLEKWGGTRRPITSYRWDFCDGGVAFGQTVSHPFGRAGSCTVTLTVTDDASQQASDTSVVTVTNVVPSVTAQANPTVVDEGSPFVASGSFDDPSWNDTFPIVRWDFGYVDTMRGLGPTVDASWSPPPGYRNTHHDVSGVTWIYGDNGNYTPVLTVQDEFGGSDSDSASVYVRNVRPTLVNVTVILHQNAPRTHGYWKHQCTIVIPKPDHPGIRQEWIDAIRTQSTVFTDVYTKANVCAYLDPPTPLTPMKRAKMQLIALWLNAVSGLLWIDSPLHHPGAPGDDTVREFIAHAESLILTDPTDTNLNWVATIATDINEDAEGGADWQYIDPVVGEYVAYAVDPGTDDLYFVWSTGRPMEPHVVHQVLNGGTADPDYEPVSNEVRTPEETYPFSATDRLIVGYPPNLGGGVSAALLCLIDDDGDASIDANGFCGEAGVLGGAGGGPGPVLHGNLPATMAQGGSAQLSSPSPGPTVANVTVDWSFSFSISYRTIEGGFIVADVAASFLSYDGKVVPNVTGGSFG